MISLRLNGTSVPLPNNFKAEAEYTSPLFEWDAIRGRRVYQLDLPYSYETDKILGFPTDPTSPLSNAAVKAELMHGGDLIMEAYIKLLSVNKATGFKTYISEDLNKIFGDYQTSLLSELPLGSEAIPSPLPANPDHTTAKFCFPKIDNSAFYGETIPPTYSGYVNDYTGGAYTTDSPKVPMIFLKWLLQKIGEITNLSISGDFVEDPAMQRLFLLNMYAINGASAITYTNHLPDISLISFFFELRKMFCLRYDFDVINRTLKMSYLKTTLKADCKIDLTYQSSPSNERRVDKQSRLEISSTFDPNDALFKSIPVGFEKYQTPTTAQNDGSSFFAINTLFSSTMMNGANPVIKQIGTNLAANLTGAKLFPRLLFWSGLVSSIPTASNTYGSLTLTTASIVDNLWKDFEDWKTKTTPSTRPVNLTPADVALLQKDLGQKIHIRGVNYYIQNLIAPLPIKTASLLNLYTA